MGIKMRTIFLVVGLLVLSFLLEAKRVTKQLTKQDLESKEKRIFLTKFDFGSQGGGVRIRMTKEKPLAEQSSNIRVDVVIDDQLDAYLSRTCQGGSTMIVRTQVISLRQAQTAGGVSFIIPILDRQHIYYFYISTCRDEDRLDRLFEDEERPVRLQINLENDGSQFGEDENFIAGYILLVVIWVVMIVKFFKTLIDVFIQSRDQAKVTAFAGLVALGAAYFYRLLHFAIYYSNGEGIHFFELLYIIIKSSCEFIIVTFMIAVSWGWSITHLKHDQSYIVAGALAAIINTVGLIVNASAQEIVDTHHKYDSTPGYILQILRVIVILIFIVGIFRTLSLSVGNIRRFIKKFGLIGGFYLSSWPAIVIFAQLVLPNYMHNQVITFVQEITHLIATGLLCQILAHPESSYRKISIKEEDNPLKMSNYKRK